MIVGVLGGGQLGRMLALAGYPLGLRFRFLDPAADAPAGHLAQLVTGTYEDEMLLRRWAADLHVVTYEFENVPVGAARLLEAHVPVFPPPAALDVAQDRLAEKTFFRRLGIATPPFEPVHSLDELQTAAAHIGLPAVLKTRRFGYDGKGQQVLRVPGDLAPAVEALGDVPLILEGLVPFEREMSIIGVRARDGTTAFYPLVENEHRDGMLHRSTAPAPGTSGDLQATAEHMARAVLEALDYVGVLAVELFEAGGRLIANEMAPRVHNSGHWTIEGAETSQFENHLRAILGLPLGSTAMRGHTGMLNVIGTLPNTAAVLAVPGAHLHLYGKAPRPGRKLGHVTLQAGDPDTLGRGMTRLSQLIP
jgi:5-(carboxyamino)imidazole ribonucleotide synthase